MRRTIWMIAACLVPTIGFADPIGAPRKSVFEKALNVILATVAPHKPANIREQIIKDYENADANKGLAIELLSGNTWRSTEHEDQAVTGDRTLEGCQLRYGKPCALIAVNEEIVAEGELISRDMPRLHYSGQFDLAKIPVIRFVTRNRVDVQNYFSSAGPKAMAIVSPGRVYTGYSNVSLVEAEEMALTKCRSDAAHEVGWGPCFLYAVNNDIVLPKRLDLPQH